MESEFISLDKCEEGAEWLRQFVEDIPWWLKPVTTISIHCDSQSAIGRAQSIMYIGKSRHIHRRYNSIRQLLSTRVISIDYVASKDNIADPFTKGLSRELVSKSSKGKGTKSLKGMSLYEGKPNLVDWRSQDLGSIGQPNHKNVGEVTSMWESYLNWNFLVHSYNNVTC
uniref:Ribonuclease H-like domain containing protein n=1 Tax=Tanacetum cinerariifolium TaxID=118510 RepID=A0A6L2MA81_TANCI|nr:ribonuclease H-like domain containing protein [Tanacetum cinerariifolium]